MLIFGMFKTKIKVKKCFNSGPKLFRSFIKITLENDLFSIRDKTCFGDV